MSSQRQRDWQLVVEGVHDEKPVRIEFRNGRIISPLTPELEFEAREVVASAELLELTPEGPYVVASSATRKGALALAYRLLDRVNLIDGRTPDGDGSL